MTRAESSILLHSLQNENGIDNHYRLLRSLDPFHGNDVFSIFVTTQTKETVDDEFVYDIARDESTAIRRFSLICRESVCACTLADVLQDLITEETIA